MENVKSFITTIAIFVLAVSVGAFVMRGVSGLFNDEPAINRESYLRVGKKACVQEATRYGGVTDAQADEYCQCAIDELYEGKTVEQMRKMDGEMVDGELPAKYDYIILMCQERLY